MYFPFLSHNPHHPNEHVAIREGSNGDLFHEQSQLLPCEWRIGMRSLNTILEFPLFSFCGI
jgi:hypothetical protein